MGYCHQSVGRWDHPWPIPLQPAHCLHPEERKGRWGELLAWGVEEEAEMLKGAHGERVGKKRPMERNSKDTFKRLKEK